MVKKEKIKELIELLENSEVNEIEVTSFWGAKKIRVSQAVHHINMQPKSDYPTHDHLTLNKEIDEKLVEKPSIQKEENKDKQDHVQNEFENKQTHEVTAPLVGTYFSSPRPEDPPFVKEGDVITEGQTICIIEAMKIFNEIESETSGKITKIIPQDNQPVEYGQVLMLVEIE